jgi:hypothetical protein
VLGPGEGVDVFTGVAAAGKRKGGAPKAPPLAIKQWAPVRG